jgi:hypothetical protein
MFVEIGRCKKSMGKNAFSQRIRRSDLNANLNENNNFVVKFLGRDSTGLERFIIVKSKMTGVSSDETEKSGKSAKTDNLETTSTKVNVTRYVTAIGESSFVPKNIQPHILKAAPHIGEAVHFLESLIPIIEAYYAKALALW